MKELTKEQIAEWYRDGEMTVQHHGNVKVMGFGATQSNAYADLQHVFQRMNEGSQEDYSTIFDKAFKQAVECGMIASSGRKRNSVSRKSELVYHFVSMTPLPHNERPASRAQQAEQFIMEGITPQ